MAVGRATPGSPRRVDQSMARAAALALDGVSVTSELRTRYRQLPVMMRTSGLVAAYAYLVEKSDTKSDLGRAYSQAATAIRLHLENRHLVRPESSESDGRRNNLALIEKLACLAAHEYARAAEEAGLLANWLSRLAEAKRLVSKESLGETT